MFTSSYNEIIGLPGSGKSYACKILVDHAKKQNIVLQTRQPLNLSVFDRFYIVIKVLRFVIINREMLKWWMIQPLRAYTVNPHTRKIVRNLKFRVIIESIIIQKIQKNNSVKILNDEGIIGKIVVLSLLLNRDTIDVLKLLKVLLPDNTRILFIDIEVQKALKQMLERGVYLPFWDEMDPTQRHKLCQDCNTRYLEICLKWFQITKGNYYIITNNGTKQDLASNLISNFDLNSYQFA